MMQCNTSATTFRTVKETIGETIDKSIDATTRRTIAIIGGGFSGTLVAAQLLHQAREPLVIQLIERNPAIGRGVAYGTASDCHLLNVPAGKMSAFADEPDHFFRWLQTEAAIDSVTPTTFVPRRLYGQYMQAVLHAAEARAFPGVQLERICEEAIALKPDSLQWVIGLSNGEWLTADAVVLALGNFPPGNPPVADPTFYQSHRYISSAWSSLALMHLHPTDPVLLIGSGLTMLDLAIALQQQRHQGLIHVVSRRGLLPQPHQTTVPYPAFLSADQAPKTVRSLMRHLRQKVAAAATQGYDWRSVVDALRSETPALWQSLPLEEQRRFLRHGRVYWEVHRHRVAPAIANQFTQLQASGQLRVYAGRIQTYNEDSTGVNVTVRLRREQKAIVLHANRVINCTGPECDYRKFRHPLIQNSLNAGVICPDALSLGLEVAANGALVNAAGEASTSLYTLGSLQKGRLWETTAVPEIRQQAERLARELLGTI